MDKDAHEQYELEQALIETWGTLQEAHLLLENANPSKSF
jgi:hypothetical protein